MFSNYTVIVGFLMRYVCYAYGTVEISKWIKSSAVMCEETLNLRYISAKWNMIFLTCWG